MGVGRRLHDRSLTNFFDYLNNETPRVRQEQFSVGNLATRWLLLYPGQQIVVVTQSGEVVDSVERSSRDTTTTPTNSWIVSDNLDDLNIDHDVIDTIINDVISWSTGWESISWVLDESTLSWRDDAFSLDDFYDVEETGSGQLGWTKDRLPEDIPGAGSYELGEYDRLARDDEDNNIEQPEQWDTEQPLSIGQTLGEWYTQFELIYFYGKHLGTMQFSRDDVVDGDWQYHMNQSDGSDIDSLDMMSGSTFSWTIVSWTVLSWVLLSWWVGNDTGTVIDMFDQVISGTTAQEQLMQKRLEQYRNFKQSQNIQSDETESALDSLQKELENDETLQLLLQNLQ